MKEKKFISPSLENRTVEELTAQLIDVNAQLTALQHEREMMLSNISHDLRAPITAIRGALDLTMSATEVSVDEYRRILALIDRRTKTLEDLINDMYYLFCVEDTGRPLQFEPVAMAPFLEEYFYDVIADSRYDNFDMQLDVPSDLDATVMLDVQKFLRVLDNLFTNAAKYAADSDTSPSIKLSAALNTTDNATDHSDNPMLVITVSDTGHGIPKEALPYIFTRTYTVSDARTPEVKNGGSGLGLSIAKAIIDRHNGSISCESTIGSGTVFTISLPLN